MTQTNLHMKTRLLTLLMVAMFGFGLASCNKCQTCGDCPSGMQLSDENGNLQDEVEICEDDADSKEDYDAAIAIIEAFGCTCK